MLGGLLSLLSAITFAYANASVRRGVLSGTVLQAVGISLPIALPIFALVMWPIGGFAALAVAPVSVVSPIQRLSLVFRIYFGWIINPKHEVFGGRIVAGTVLSLLGAVALSVSVEDVQHVLPLPDMLAALLNWHWSIGPR